ncbi:MAG: pyridoxamine 5'-phosphate oxidase family protein [Candidatus Omnitrophica bacterium]|nr:pyridoxamine 5'-phosphate oxidase family protein [Candidatus Omnitrophota bacterium]
MTKEEVIDLIKDSGYCTLATVEGTQPRVRPMSPYLTDDGKLLMALFVHLRTVRQIQENPMVEMCFVDRKMCFCRIAGKAIVSKDSAKKEILWNNIPMLKQYFGGISDPNFCLVEVDIKEVEAMSPQQMQPDRIKF